MKFSKIAIILVALFYIFVNTHRDLWTGYLVLKRDVVDYYSYLPAIFIYKDAGMKFIDDDPDFFLGKLWGRKLENGNYVVKTTMGMAILYSPFFFSAHIIAQHTKHEANGFTAPYAAALAISSLFYFLLGLILLRKLLLRFFNETTTGITIILLSLATNITIYLTLQPAFSHSYNFFLFAVFIYLIPVWYEKQSIKNSILIGLCFGMITLIRPTNGLIALVFIFWNIDSFSALKTRINFFIKHAFYIAIIGLFCIILWIPQFIFWKIVTGHFFYYSYGEEGFFFLQPKIFDVLFSFRKGWLLYTPIMIFGILGFIQIYKNYRKLFAPLSIFFILNLYVISSWWCWWYGGSFGQRVFIDSYPLMAIPLAAFVSHHLSFNIKRKISLYLICFFFLFHNLFQTAQYFSGAIHWDSMSYKAYKETLFSLTPTPEFFEYLIPPDYENAIKGLPERKKETDINKIAKDNLKSVTYLNDYEFLLLHFNDFEIKNIENAEISKHLSDYVKFSGETSYLANSTQHYLPTFAISISELKKQNINAIMAEYSVFSFEPIPDESLYLVISIESDTEVKYYNSSSSTAKKIVLGKWNTRNILIDLPSGISEELTLKCYIWNKEGKAKAYVDFFKVYGIRNSK